MPDGDSLNWKVRGRGSRRVLGLIRSGSYHKTIAHETIRMFTQQAKDGSWKPAMLEMVEALETALRQIPFGADFLQQANVFDRLSRRLGWIAAARGGEGLAILVRAAERTFDSDELPRGELTRDKVEKQFLAEAARALLDNRVLDPVRSEVAQELRRHSAAQACFEKELRDAVGVEGKRAQLRKTFFEDPNNLNLRTPPRTLPKKKTDLARLSESLPVLGGEE